MSFTQIVDKPFDSTWSGIIERLAASPLHIDNFEKASGLITLSFGSPDPGLFVTGGAWELKGTWNFKGDYVDYLAQYADAQLLGTMNVVVTPLERTRTRVSVKASYNLTATIPDRGTYTWAFESGGSSLQRVFNVSSANGDSMIVVPTNRAENIILGALTPSP
jgi:hypothetical protein